MIYLSDSCSFFRTVLEFSKTGIVVNRERRRMAEKRRAGRQQAVSEHKRELILDAAREVFAAEGLEGASLRAIATRAGYTPAALYFHFDSKEAIYAEVLRGSLTSLGAAVG